MNLRWASMIGLAVLLAACEPPAPPEPKAQNVRPARIHVVEASQSASVLRFAGAVEASTSIDAAFEVGGALSQLDVLEGETVKAGDLLAALDPTDFLLAVRESEAQLRLVRQDFERKRDILGRGGIARSAVDDAAAELELARVRLAQAQKRLRDARLTAPFDAQIARRFVDNHTKVQAGEAIVRLSALSELVIAAAMPQALLATLNADAIDSISARFAFAPDRDFPLTYRENRGEADAMAQTFEIALTMTRPEDLNILPGMSAEVTVTLKQQATAPTLTIPTAALVSHSDGRFFVWVVPPVGGAVEQRFVEVGTPTSLGVPVVSGLTSGEAIVSSGAAYLQPGMSVRRLERI